MNSPEFKDAVCRICLDENVALDWNNTLADHCDVTYKDCYYKYTQLKPLDIDLFSSKLCQECIYSLENTHELILKALDSYNFLQEVNCVNSEVDDSMITDDDTNFISTDFETVLVEKTDTESLVQDQFEYENSDDLFDNASVKTEDNKIKSRVNSSPITEAEEYFYIEREHEECDIDQALQLDNAKDNVSKAMKSCRKSSTRSKLVKNDTYSNKIINKKLKTAHSTRLKTPTENKAMDTKVRGSTSKRCKGKIKYENTPSMCSFCSKILHNKYSLQKHEKIHIVNRERKATCPICGVKFFEEAYVKSHMQIHNANRVKKHKCEFCDKAFFEKGGLNVHRRIHLGQMIPCNLCSKEFFRQVDLDIHMNSHSAILINAETKKRSRYWVRCKHCNKNVISTSFKSHTAVHLNEPLMKCSISKILHNKYAVQRHEKTHMENRDRNETCKICGLKFYDKRNLYSHKRIHKENREKNHKCEFCDKAFYNKGALNIHRRIHLGQMVPCNLCKKQFFRQIDLERHMSSHSATAINSDTKKRSRYFVRCEHCDKSILSTSFKSHTAAHLNEPLMKCSICSKEFFRRASCVRHVKKVHQKTNEEYNNFIIKYKENRISHLYLAQKADIQFSDE